MLHTTACFGQRVVSSFLAFTQRLTFCPLTLNSGPHLRFNQQLVDQYFGQFQMDANSEKT